ncbi:D-3-phosphoglycerate dehydrogenase [hydrothermal vent metagenome]|uniref:phosphoglycerate dehydrogenase n=1 Tax=hydrothermal vent metagenome TaxID=652676 RepID=A0A3B0R1T9_9ZZZZ
MPNVLIADKLSPAAVQIFTDEGIKADVRLGLSKPELIKIIGQYDGLVVRSKTKPDADIIAAASKLKVIGRAGIGVDNIDIPAASAKGIVVMNTPFGNAITTAEHAIAMMFACARNIPVADRSTRDGKWEKSSFVGTELFGKTLGLIGCGNIGALVAERALGLKMQILAYDPYLTEERAIEIGVNKVELKELLTRADVISLHTPLTDQTRNILSATALNQTKSGVMIVNCARGGLVDEAALYAGLVSGHVRAAALDVYVQEPVTDNPLFTLPNFVGTPHLGASTREAQENVAVQVARQMSDFLLTGAVSNALNMPSVSAEDAPRLKPYLGLAEKLGLLAGQMTAGGLSRVEISFQGAVARMNVKPLTATALAGILRPILCDVNMVSAPIIAADRGIHLAETCEEQKGDFDTVIEISLEDETGRRELAGTLFAGEPRLIRLDDVQLDAPFQEHMLFVSNEDQPGHIGALGEVLGENGVNIATFNLGRAKIGDRAVSLLGLDAPISAKTLEQVKALSHVRKAYSLKF